jgi:hypothetical protein
MFVLSQQQQGNKTTQPLFTLKFPAARLAVIKALRYYAAATSAGDIR